MHDLQNPGVAVGVVDSRPTTIMSNFEYADDTAQVTLLTDDIEAGFERNDTCGAVIIDLSAAYDTFWHRGLKLKLNNVIPDKSLVNFIMTMIASRAQLHNARGC